MGELDEARPALVELLELLPNIEAAVLFGRAPQRGWKWVAGLGPGVPAASAPHPATRMNDPARHTAIARALGGARERAVIA